MISHLNRRSFLSGAATLATLAACSGRDGQQAANAQEPFGEVVDDQAFASLQNIGENIWAVVSKPLNPDGSFNPQTVCNGGLVAGADRVVAIDAFLQPAGAQWLARQAQTLLGRPITDVIVTHFHADHSGGLAGFQRGADGPEIIATETTRKLVGG